MTKLDSQDRRVIDNFLLSEAGRKFVDYLAERSPSTPNPSDATACIFYAGRTVGHSELIYTIKQLPYQDEPNE